MNQIWWEGCEPTACNVKSLNITENVISGIVTYQEDGVTWEYAIRLKKSTTDPTVFSGEHVSHYDGAECKNRCSGKVWKSGNAVMLYGTWYEDDAGTDCISAWHLVLKGD